MERSRLEDIRIDSVDFVKGSGDDPHARIKIAKASEGSGDSKDGSGKSYFDQILESRRAGEEKQRVSELTSALSDAVEMAASADEIEQLTAQYVSAVRTTMAKSHGEYLEINKSTGAFRDRGELDRVVSKAAQEMHPDRSEEASLGKFSTTKEGRTLRRMARELPEPEPDPMIPAFEKEERSGTEALLDREASRIAKRDGISREQAYGKVKREAPDSLLKAYRQSRR